MHLFDFDTPTWQVINLNISSSQPRPGGHATLAFTLARTKPRNNGGATAIQAPCHAMYGAAASQPVAQPRAALFPPPPPSAPPPQEEDQDPAPPHLLPRSRTFPHRRLGSRPGSGSLPGGRTRGGEEGDAEGQQPHVEGPLRVVAEREGRGRRRRLRRGNRWRRRERRRRRRRRVEVRGD